ncbi:MAG: ABC transporter ATP-binding protein [Clostridia bacterium]|nr:ABC transporter ATP-binding protein [Clostridia bacterium]
MESQTAPKKPAAGKAALLWRFLKGSKRFYIGAILCAVAITFLDMLTPQIIRVTVDNVLDTKPLNLPQFLQPLLNLVGGVEGLKQNLWMIAVAVVAVALVIALFRFGNMTLTAKASETLVQSMRNQLFSHIQRLPFSWHMKNQTGDIIQRCTSDVEMIRNFVTDQLMQVLRVVVLLTLSLSFMISMNLKLSVVAMVSIPIVVSYSVFFHQRIGKRFTECDENEGILSTIAQENLTGVRVVRAFGREKYEKDRFDKQNEHYTNLWVKLCRTLSYFWGLGDGVSMLQVMLVIVLGSSLCVKGEMTSGELISFISYNAMLTWPVRSLGRMISEMSKAGVSIDRLSYIMASEAEKDKPDATTPPLDGEIRYENVSFSYDEEHPILENVSFTIPAGSTFAILGSTGSGKSTLMHLLNRLYDLPAENGRITIGGVDVADMKAAWLREHVGMVLQEPFLFSRTIGENIGITRRDMTLSDIRQAAEIACIADTVDELTKGYDTIVGERGVTLSGGQKQRTAIARMLTQKTPIMVFDDSLSAVDAQTDLLIRTRLKERMKDATVILISHRVTTLMQADQILVLDKGRAVQLGSHEELVQQEGIYKQIYELQMSRQEEEVGA